MPLYASTIFLSAFLLFQVQPVIAKIILPWFGGSAAVWALCLLFFQTVLLLGYLYAFWSARTFTTRTQAAVHAALLALSLLLLPITPDLRFRSAGADPTANVLILLTVSVGLPYFLLSSTSPLLQAWYARGGRGRIPYRLFALSNAGSMLGLLSYPALVEPFWASHRQALTWSAAYALFALLCGAVALEIQAAPTESEAAEAEDTVPGAAGSEPGRGLAILWAALAACASALLLAVTNHLTQNMAAVPFLWVLPLALYLLSFILGFSGKGWYRRRIWMPLLVPASAGMAWMLSPGHETASLKVMGPVFAGGLFVVCMVCHGELAALAPHPGRLTFYYLMIALGGAVGGLLVALAAPRLFSGYFELPAALAASVAAALAVLCRDACRMPRLGLGERLGLAAFFPFAAALAVLLAVQVHDSTSGSRLMVRNFYGGLRVSDGGDAGEDPGPVRRLVHGTITHGLQFLRPDRRRRPTAYYGPDSGVGLAIRHGSRDATGRRVGVIGLGTGTLACYGRPGDYYRFYEINPMVIRLAGTEFSFLGDSKARIDVVPGDARLSLEGEPGQRFDVLVVDAFSGDSIPVHLLTREAFALYFSHLKAGGVLAVHISNKYLDLEPVVQRAAKELGKEGRRVDTKKDEGAGTYGSSWILVTADRGFLGKPAVRGASRPLRARTDLPPWTDDYSNLLRVLK